MASTTPIPSLKPTSKRRSFRPSTFKPLASTNPSSLATLNDSLRASLMNVGMRVRKSVPEGYKTTAKPAFSIYEQTAAAHPELEPFGGFIRAQPLQSPTEGPAADPLAMIDEDLMTDGQLADAVGEVLDNLGHDLGSFVASSQESSISATSSVRWAASQETPSSRRKRSLGDGSGGDDVADGEDDSDVDLLCGAFGGAPMDGYAPLRPIAQPRSRRPHSKRTARHRSEKNVPFVPLSSEDDFAEADFLVPHFGLGP